MEFSIQDWGAIGEIVGGIAVVATLIYLGIQLRQNTAGMQASAFQQWVAVHTQIMAGVMDKDVAAAVQAGAADTRNLTEDNYVQFITYCRQFMHMQQAQYYLYRQGVIREEIWNYNRADLIGFFVFPGVKQWWEAGARTHFTPDFVRMLEESDEHAIMMLWDKERGLYPSPYHTPS